MRILIAEDEPFTRSAYDLAMRARGHFAIVTENGYDCIAVYKEHLRRARSRPSNKSNNNSGSQRQDESVPFDAVILDYRMPEKDGMQVAREVLQENPKQRIIFASAYVEDTLNEESKKLNCKVELLQKPFRMSTLVDMLEEKEIFVALKQYGVNISQVKKLDLDHESLSRFLQAIREFMKDRADVK